MFRIHGKMNSFGDTLISVCWVYKIEDAEREIAMESHGYTVFSSLGKLFSRLKF